MLFWIEHWVILEKMDMPILMYDMWGKHPIANLETCVDAIHLALNYKPSSICFLKKYVP